MFTLPTFLEVMEFIITAQVDLLILRKIEIPLQNVDTVQKWSVLSFSHDEKRWSH